MDYDGPDVASDDFVSSSVDGAESWADADQYLLNDIGVALRLISERM